MPVVAGCRLLHTFKLNCHSASTVNERNKSVYICSAVIAGIDFTHLDYAKRATDLSLPRHISPCFATVIYYKFISLLELQNLHTNNPHNQ